MKLIYLLVPLFFLGCSPEQPLAETPQTDPPASVPGTALALPAESDVRNPEAIVRYWKNNNSSCIVSYGPRTTTHYIAVFIVFCIIRAYYCGMTTDEILPILAERVKQLRKKERLSQPEIARRAGMSLRSYQAFEATGNIALKKLANVLVVLEMEGELARFLAAPKPTFKSLDDFEKTSPSSLKEI